MLVLSMTLFLAIENIVAVFRLIMAITKIRIEIISLANQFLIDGLSLLLD